VVVDLPGPQHNLGRHPEEIAKPIDEGIRLPANDLRIRSLADIRGGRRTAGNQQQGRAETNGVNSDEPNLVSLNGHRRFPRE